MEHINEDCTLQTLCRDTHNVCNEEGKMQKLPLCRAVYDEEGHMQDIIAGPFFICFAPIGSETFQSMPTDVEHEFMAKFELPERFFRGDNGIEAVSFDPGMRENDRDR